jgi:hypothetical protein
MTTIIKNTNIKELLEVARGNFQVLEKMTEEFRRLVQLRPNKSGPSKGGRKAMTTRQAIAVVTEIIRENRGNGELEGVLNRHRIAALNHLVRVAQGATASTESSLRE